jgi:hypothetical protein
MDFFGVQTVDTGGRYTPSYLLAGPANICDALLCISFGLFFFFSHFTSCKDIEIFYSNARQIVSIDTIAIHITIV